MNLQDYHNKCLICLDFDINEPAPITTLQIDTGRIVPLFQLRHYSQFVWFPKVFIAKGWAPIFK